MALFGKNKKETKKDVPEKSKVSSKMIEEVSGISYDVILHPRITEKATEVAEDANVYTFDVDSRATKAQVSKAVYKLYKVEPVKVRTVTIPKKDASRRGRNQGYKGGGKKAYVFLKKGDTIEFV